MTPGDAPLLAGLRVVGRRCLVVGAGPVGLEKARGLLACKAEVAVVAPEAVEELVALATEGALSWSRRCFEATDAAGALLVFAATADLEANTRICEEARRHGALVSVANSPELSDFIVPAVVRAGPFCVAATTGGASPALAKRLRRELARRYRTPLARLLAATAELAEQGRRDGRIARYDDLQKLLDELAESPAAAALLDPDHRPAP